MSLTVRRFFALSAVSLAALLAGVAPAGAQTGADYIASENVTLLKSIPTAGDGVGARVIGNYLYVTSTKDLEIFDITNPEDPQMVGTATVNIEFENEEVPTNGKLLGISGQTPTVNSGGVCPSLYPLTSNSGCLALYDVRDPAAPKLLTNVQEAGDHTSTCVLDCTYFYGSSGSVTDATKVFDAGNVATRIGNWQDSATVPDFNGDDDGKFVDGCHHVQELEPGILIGACQPTLLMSVRPEDGGSILAPKVLATASNEDGRFIHSVHWPSKSADRLMLSGGETNFQPQCGPDNGAFMTWDASHAKVDGIFSGPLDEFRPTNGSYLDSNPPAQILGCSVHWFEEHQTFKNGGLVALAAYENGTRFLQIGTDGKITEQGFFIPLGGSTSAPHWAPGSDVVYAVDYTRGLDVLKYNGEHYVPGAPPEPGKVPGTAGPPAAGTPGGPPAGGASAPACKASAGFSKVAAKPNRHADHGRVEHGLRFNVKRRTKRPFEVDVVQQARGRKLTRNRNVARFTGRTTSFTWDGEGASNGWYVVRFEMPLPNGNIDVRRVAFRRTKGRFVKRPASYLTDPCGALKSFKLQRPVFGGGKNVGLKISYSLPRGVDRVSVVASTAKGRVLKRFEGTGAEANKLYRLVLPAKGIARGTDIRVRLTVVRAGTRQSTVLISRRI